MYPPILGFQPRISRPRYDLFIKSSVLEIIGDIKKTYSMLAQHIREKLDPCQVSYVGICVFYIIIGQILYVYKYVYTRQNL